jgi:hypothetical protein
MKAPKPQTENDRLQNGFIKFLYDLLIDTLGELAAAQKENAALKRQLQERTNPLD